MSTTKRTPLTAPEELDAILEGTMEPGDLSSKGEPVKPAEGPRALLPARAASLDKRVQIRVKADGWREAENKVEKMLEKDPDAVIEVFMGKNTTPAYVASWPVENRKGTKR